LILILVVIAVFVSFKYIYFFAIEKNLPRLRHRPGYKFIQTLISLCLLYLYEHRQTL
jgi:hypothetical protein